ncbi:zinc-dependent metalloprotease [Virgibacillus flavescens]|uniref:zinc-dependent metalloprotease n=1 Tax=Virgibacillus flavescens TaxID=1611422 RepID=UPI003D357F43
MKAKRLTALTLALSVTLLPAFTSASPVEINEVKTTLNGKQIEMLPTAKKKQKNKEEAIVERATTVEILDTKGKKVGSTKFDATSANKSKSESKAQVAATRTVTVLAVADEEYRAAHSNWQTLVQNAVEQADDAFNRDHAIDYQVTGLGNWSSQGGNASQILYDLEADWSGYSNYDFVVGFTRDTNFNSGGIAYVYPSAPSGSAFSVNLDQGAYNTWHAAQHEFSHNFGLPHDAQGSGIKCIMNYDYSYQVDYWDADHDAKIENNEHWY